MRYTIRGVPESLAEIPENLYDYIRWRAKALAFRAAMRKIAASDPIRRAAIMELCARDQALDLLIWGVIYEPRAIVDYTIAEGGEVYTDRDPETGEERGERTAEPGQLIPFLKPSGWYPWIPYGFQVEVMRFLEYVTSLVEHPLGRSDAVMEKSRDMGLTWIVCHRVAWKWRTATNYTVGLFSRKEELVDSNDSRSMFYRVEALLGLNRRIPETVHAPGTIWHGHEVRVPDHLLPAGFDAKKHDQKLKLIHPTRANEILGEATTSKSGIGTRTSESYIDEGSKIEDLIEMWSGMGPVTNHRIVLGSADRRYGDGMYILANRAKLAAQDPRKAGPSFLTLPWHRHPFRDPGWLERERNRYEGSGQEFSREYEINWDAGMGDFTYPMSKTILPQPDIAYDPSLGEVYCAIDPALRDPTSVVYFQYDPLEHHYHVIDAIELYTPSAKWFAPILMGWPPGHEVREGYPDRAIQDLMDFAWELRRTGRPVKYVGDTYGNNSGGAERQSFYEAMYLRASELNTQFDDLPPARLIVMTKYDEQARWHRKRKECLANLLTQLVFADRPRVRYVLEAIQNNRYKSQDEGRLVVSEPSDPAHDWTSHATTACEYFAVIAMIAELSRRPQLTPQTRRRRAPKTTRSDPAGWSRSRSTLRGY